MKNLEFDFSVGFDGEIEYTSGFDSETGEGILEEITDVILQKVLDKNKLTIGERCEGTLTSRNDIIRIECRWCSDVGEDWNDDVWEDDVVEFPVSDIE